MYQCKVDLDLLNAVKIKLADVSSVSPLSEHTHGCDGAKLCSDEGLTLKTSANLIFIVFNISKSTLP